MIVGNGLAIIMSEIMSNIDIGAVGSGTLAVSESDTDLNIQTGTISVTDESVNNQTYTCQTRINSAFLASTTISEHGLKRTDGTLFSRITHPNFTHTSGDELIYFSKITLERGS